RDEFARMLALLRHMVSLTPQQYRESFTTATSVPELLTTISCLSSELKQRCDEFAIGMQHLVTLVALKERDAYFVWGQFFHELLVIGLYQVLNMKAPASWGRHIVHLEPGNPIDRMSNGGIFHQEVATSAQRKTLEQYFSSLQPKTKPGPEPGYNSMPPDFPDQVRKAYATLLNALDADPYITEEAIINAMDNRQSTSTFKRWLKDSTGLTWKPFKKILERWQSEFPDLPWEQSKRLL